MPLTNQGYTGADVSVAIVSYNTRDLLERCILSLLPERPASIVVIDNASPDGSAAYVKARFPDVIVIANAANVGYGAAVNQAMRSTTSPLVLILNADTEVRPGCVEALAAISEREPRAGIVAPAIINRRGVREASVFPFPGTFDWLLENAPLAPLIRHIPRLRKRAISLSPPDTPRPVPWVLGCAMLLRRECMDAVGGFDEGYFMYYEEVDLCRRVSHAGWEVFFDPEAEVMHVGGASTRQLAATMRIRRFESAMLYYHRYYSGARLAFWMAVMRLKQSALLVRDSAQLLVERDPSERARLFDQKLAWSMSLEVSREFGRGSGAIRVGDQRAG